MLSMSHLSKKKTMRNLFSTALFTTLFCILILLLYIASHDVTSRVKDRTEECRCNKLSSWDVSSNTRQYPKLGVSQIPTINKFCKYHTDEEGMDEIMASVIGESIEPDNPELIENIRTHFLDPPSPYLTKFSLPLFKTPLAEAVDGILKKKTKGFFVECGALDGERSSNSIFFEQKRQWNGLLVEMDPSYYLQIRGKNRKCYSMNACISLNNYPQKMNFKEHSMGQGKLSTSDDAKAHIRTAYCFPFFSMMLALNVTKIDYFSLDVEGLEIDILKTIPFDKLDISVLTVERSHGKDEDGHYAKFMKSKGYRVHKIITASKPEIYFGCNDYVFVKEDL